MNRTHEPPPDYDNAKGYADAWGYRLGSPVASLIDAAREEYRAKYGCDYRLVRTGKNKYRITAGDRGSYGYTYLRDNAARFGVNIESEALNAT